jgi:hypothetical protein
MTQLLRYIAVIASGAICAVALNSIATWAYVMWYMHEYNIASRSELSEDYGFGIVGLGVSVVSLAAGFIVGMLATRAVLRMQSRRSNGA